MGKLLVSAGNLHGGHPLQLEEAVSATRSSSLRSGYSRSRAFDVLFSVPVFSSGLSLSLREKVDATVLCARQWVDLKEAWACTSGVQK